MLLYFLSLEKLKKKKKWREKGEKKKDDSGVIDTERKVRNCPQRFFFFYVNLECWLKEDPK